MTMPRLSDEERKSLIAKALFNVRRDCPCCDTRLPNKIGRTKCIACHVTMTKAWPALLAPWKRDPQYDHLLLGHDDIDGDVLKLILEGRVERAPESAIDLILRDSSATEQIEEITL